MPLNDVSYCPSTSVNYQPCDADNGSPTGESNTCRLGAQQPVCCVVSPTPSSSCSARFCRSLRNTLTIQPSDPIPVKLGKVVARGIVGGITGAAANALGQNIAGKTDIMNRYIQKNIEWRAIIGAILGTVGGVTSAVYEWHPISSFTRH